MDYHECILVMLENGEKLPKVHISPLGRYRLEILNVQTTPGSWDHTEGKVYNNTSNELIATIQRNYCSFPFTFIEYHPKGKFLVCGADYQGQTVIKLDTGSRRDFLPEEAAKGHGFCWSRHHFDVESQLLMVDGCLWACPYEFRFYDFSNPMAGWPELSHDMMIDAGHEWPIVTQDGRVVCSEFRQDDDDSSEEDVWILTARQTFRRNNLSLDFIERWETDEEKQRVIDREIARKLYEEKQARFRASDPL